MHQLTVIEALESWAKPLESGVCDIWIKCRTFTQETEVYIASETKNQC